MERKREDAMTFKKKLHTVLCINGGISDRTVRLMSGSLNYKRKALSEMKQRGLLEKQKSVIRLTRMGLIGPIWNDHLKEDYLVLAEGSRTACIKATGGELRRRMYQGEVLTLMLEAGAELCEGGVDRIPERIAYMRGRQLKADAGADLSAVRRSRAQGTLFGAEGALYNVYAMGGGVLMWNHCSEAAYRAYVEQVNLEKRGKNSEARAILFVDDIGNFPRFIKRRMDRGGPIRAGDIYEKVYALPKSPVGTELLNVMLLPWSERVAEELCKERAAFNFLIPDLERLRVYALTEEGKGSICCMEGYEEGVRAVMPDAVIMTVKIGELTDRVLQAGGQV